MLFQNLPIKELVPGLSNQDPSTFSSLKPRMVNLLANALQVESEAVNTQLLLGGLMFMVQDTATLEQMELEKNNGGAQRGEGVNGAGEMNRMSNGKRSYSPTSLFSDGLHSSGLLTSTGRKNFLKLIHYFLF